MAVSLATPIAHQTSADYTAFANAMTLGRPYRQPLQTAPTPNDFAPGLEMFLSSVGDISVIYSWLDGKLSWQPASATQPGNQLVLTTDSPLMAGNANLPGLKMVEALPKTATYDNVDQAAVQTALETLFNNAYAAALADATHPNNWHPAMRTQVREGTSIASIKNYLDLHTPAAATVTALVTGFLTGTGGTAMPSILVRTGDVIGRAAPYLATDPLPTAPAFALGAASDPNRARRLTFQTCDSWQQLINPIYYLHIFMRRMLLPAAGRIVTSLTNVVTSGALTHPLVTLYPALSVVAVPRAREQISGISRFPMGGLADYHGYPTSAPVSTLEWHYSDLNLFEARARVAGTTVPPLGSTTQRINRVTDLWTRYGATITAISDALQVPCEVIFGLIGAEATPDPTNANRFNERAVRLEPLQTLDRGRLRTAGVSAAIELRYDKAVGQGGSVTNVVMNPNGTSRLDFTLNHARTWRTNFLSSKDFLMLISDTDRMPITANTGSPIQTLDYQITVRDFLFRGGFANNTTQAAATTLFYTPSVRAAGNGSAAPVDFTLGRAGTLRLLHVRATGNTMNGTATITIFKNGVPTGITVTLAAGALVSGDITHTVGVASGDTLVIQVVTAGTTGDLRNLTWDFANAPAVGSSAWVLDGQSMTVPDPWAGAALVRPSSDLTWNQLVTLVDATEGRRISPGIIQTLISTARGRLPWLNALQPSIFTALGIPPPPATPGGFLNDWLLNAGRSILAGAAYIRQGYNEYGTRFDLPVVGGHYNSGRPQSDPHNPWGIVYFDAYPENAGPVSNAAATFFNTSPPVAAAVRFMR